MDIIKNKKTLTVLTNLTIDYPVVVKILQISSQKAKVEFCDNLGKLIYSKVVNRNIGPKYMDEIIKKAAIMTR